MQRSVFEVIAIRAARMAIGTFLVVGLLIGAASAAVDQKGVAGTYTDLHFNQQGGDLLGTELRIVLTRTGYQGTLQFAEGGPSELILVNVEVSGNRIKFTIPANSSYAGTFSGVVANGVLKGHFQYSGGGGDDVSLKKGKSYWD